MRRGLTRRLALALVAAVVSAVALTFALRGVPAAAVFGTLARVDPLLFAAAVAARLCVWGTKTWRWRRILTAIARRPWHGVFSALCGGYLLSALVPFKLGELARIEILRRKNELSFAAGIASLLAERAFDAAVLSALTLATLPWLPAAQRAQGRYLAAAGALGLGVAAILAHRLPAQGTASSGIGRRLAAAAARFREGLSVLRTPADAAAALAGTVVAWLFEVTATLLFMRSLGLDVPVTAAVLCILGLVLGLVIPSGPAQLGTHQLVFAVILVPFGVPRSAAVAASFLIQGTSLALLLLLGALPLASAARNLRRPPAEAGAATL